MKRRTMKISNLFVVPLTENVCCRYLTDLFDLFKKIFFPIILKTEGKAEFKKHSV